MKSAEGGPSEPDCSSDGSKDANYGAVIQMISPRAQTLEPLAVQTPPPISEVALDLWSIPIGTLPALGAHHVLGETLWAPKGRSGNLFPSHLDSPTHLWAAAVVL